MSQRGADNRLVFEALRDNIERRDPNRLIGLYAKPAHLSVVNAGVPQASPFELRGKAEIAKHLRAIFDQGASHRIERGVVDEDRVRFRETCEYPDGGRVRIETTLEVRDGKISRQVDVVFACAQAGRKEGTSQQYPTRETSPRGERSPVRPNDTSKQATETEDLK